MLVRNTTLQASSRQALPQPQNAYYTVSCIRGRRQQQQQGGASVQRRVGVQVHAFDNLKKLFGAAIPINQTPPQQQDIEEDDDATMVRLDTEGRKGVDGSDEAFGPLAVLLVGFMQDEVEQFRSILIDMEADMVKIIPCTRKMAEGTLLEALESDCPAYEQPPLGTRRTMFISGMYAAELVDVVGAYKEAGLPPCTFAAAVPNNVGRTVKELAEEVTRENQVMAQRARQAAQMKGLDADDDEE